jgi:hypothetical protein
LEPYFDLFFDISNDKLSHAFFLISKRYHDIITDGILQPYAEIIQVGILVRAGRDLVFAHLFFSGIPGSSVFGK